VQQHQFGRVWPLGFVTQAVGGCPGTSSVQTAPHIRQSRCSVSDNTLRHKQLLKREQTGLYNAQRAVYTRHCLDIPYVWCLCCVLVLVSCSPASIRQQQVEEVFAVRGIWPWHAQAGVAAVVQIARISPTPPAPPCS
jgi:hypothetical protein